MAEYKGYKEIVVPDEDANLVFTESGDIENKYDCKTNEYVVFYDEDGNVMCIKRWDGSNFIDIKKNLTFFSKAMGKVRPRNIHQKLAMDMLLDDEITIKMLSGKYGVGKDMLMSTLACQYLEEGKVDKIVYVRNNIEVKDSKPIGHLPGSAIEKLMPYAMPFADHLGGKDMLEMMISRGLVEVTHLGFIRGRDIKNSIIYCSEAENLTKEQMQLLIGRVGEGSSLWINGDCRQTDMKVFRDNSGMEAAVKALAGHKRFGYVQLVTTERSETAAMSDLLDLV